LQKVNNCPSVDSFVCCFDSEPSTPLAVLIWF